MQKLPTEADQDTARSRALTGAASAFVAWLATIAIAWMGGWFGVAIVVLVLSIAMFLFCMLAGQHARHDENDKALLGLIGRTQDAITRYAKIAAGKEP